MRLARVRERERERERGFAARRLGVASGRVGVWGCCCATIDRLSVALSLSYPVMNRKDFLRPPIKGELFCEIFSTASAVLSARAVFSAVLDRCTYPRKKISLPSRSHRTANTHRRRSCLMLPSPWQVLWMVPELPQPGKNGRHSTPLRVQASLPGILRICRWWPIAFPV